MTQQTLTRAQAEEPKIPDKIQLLEALYDLQEVSRPYMPEPFRGIAEEELMYRLKWSQPRFEAALLQAKEDPSLIRTPSGGIALTW